MHVLGFTWLATSSLPCLSESLPPFNKGCSSTWFAGAELELGFSLLLSEDNSCNNKSDFSLLYVRKKDPFCEVYTEIKHLIISHPFCVEGHSGRWDVQSTHQLLGQIYLIHSKPLSLTTSHESLNKAYLLGVWRLLQSVSAVLHLLLLEDAMP